MSAGESSGVILAPVVWLLGKVQSGKTSVIRALTGATDAEIGNGFRACTRASAIFDFPADAPVIRFLDTRGLDEAGYDPEEDIAFCKERSHLVLCTMRAMDLQQGSVLAVLGRVRVKNPSWPILVAQTTLHEGYAGKPHPSEYSFDDHGLPAESVPSGLARSLAAQRTMLGALAGDGSIRFVPIDFTRPEDGLDPQYYGAAALKRRLADVAPLAVSGALDDEQIRRGDAKGRQAHLRIVGHALAAAASDLVPFAGIVAVPGVQAQLLRKLGALYGVEWDRRLAVEFAGALGTGTLVRTLGAFGARELAKLVPVYGQTVGAAAASASSFAATYALGKAAVYYLTRRHLGAKAREGVLDVYRAAFATAFRMAPNEPASAASEPR